MLTQAHPMMMKHLPIVVLSL